MGASRTTNVSSSQLDPAMRDQFLQNVDASRQTAANLGQRQFADFTPDQQAAFEQTRQFADPNSRQMNQLGFAADMAASAGMYRPQNVRAQGVGASMMQSANIDPAAMAQSSGYQASAAQAASAGPAAQFGGASAGEAERFGGATAGQAAQFGGASAGPASQAQAAELNRGDVRNIQGGSVLQQDMGAYMSPYTQAVTQQGLSDLNRSRQIQQQQNAASATAAKAFGGSRQGVAEAETNRAFDENAARFVGQQNASAFQNAQQMAQADLARGMQAQQANQNVDLTTGQLNVQNRQQSGLANQQAANQMSQFNAANQQQAGLSNQQATNQRDQFNAANLQQAGLSNQAAANQMAQFNAGNMQQAGLSNQQATNQMAQFNAGNQQATNLANMGAQNQASQFGASAQNAASMANQQATNTRALSQAQLQQQGGLANQAAINQASQFNAGNFLQANLANQQAGLQANQQRMGASGLLSNIAGQGQQMGFAGANALAQQGGNQQQFTQAQLDSIRNLPLEQQQIINQALGLNVGGGSGMQSSSRGSGSSFSLR
jgi:hypothetical protein